MTRRYTDEEFRTILRSAMTLQQERADDTGIEGTREGLALAEIEAIASEVGVEVGFVREAAQRLDQASGPRHDNGSLRVIRAQGSIPVEADPELLSRMVDAVRDVADAPGDVQEVLGGLEWKRTGELTVTRVSLSPRTDETRVQVALDRTALLSVTITMGFVGTFMSVLGTAVAAHEGLPVLLGLVPFTATAAGVVATWKRSTSHATREVQSILRAVLDEGRDALSRLTGPADEAEDA